MPNYAQEKQKKFVFELPEKDDAILRLGY